MKIFFASSENSPKYGISRVIKDLALKLMKNNQFVYSNNFLKFFVSKTDILHIHGCWKIRLVIFFLIAKIKGVKIVISPHGMMDNNSLNKKRLKKQIALEVYQKIIFKYSNLIIVNSKFEKENFIKVISKFNKIKIIPHGVNIHKNFVPKKNFNKKLNFVFFSRIHESKNLYILVKIWNTNPFFKEFNLHIFGEVEDPVYFSKINGLINGKNIKYLGPLNTKIQYKLSKYDVLIHPSNSENFGLVIYEALSSGLFLILNKKIKKKDLFQNKFAVDINFNSNSLIKCINQILKKKKQIKSLNYKKNCIRYVKTNYDWDIISKEYVNEYLKIFQIKI